MLKRINRLPAVVRFTTAKTYSLGSLILKVKTNSLELNRIGFIISKKVAKSAVARNRTKRVVRSCVESVFEQLNKGHDVLFIIRKDLGDTDHELLCQDIHLLLKKGGLLS